MAHAQLYTSGIIERVGRNAWRIVETYAVSNASAAGLENSLWGRPHPAYPMSRCVLIRRQRNWLPGITRLTAYYRRSTGRRTAGKARLRIGIASRTERLRFDLSDESKPLEGPIRSGDAAIDGLNYARMTRGSNEVPVATAVILLDTAYERSAFSAMDIARTMKLIGRVNKDRLPNFGNFDPETLLLMSAPTTHVWDEDELWYVTYGFAVELRGWNNVGKRQTFTKLPRALPVLTVTGAASDSGQTRHVMVEVEKEITAMSAEGVPATRKTVEEDTILFKKASFKDLDAMVEW